MKSETISRKSQLIWIVSAFGVVFVADQITKAIVVKMIAQGGPHLSETFFYIVHQRNTGLMGGLFRDVPAVPFIAATFATLVLLYLYRHLERNSRLQALAYGMILGGALGNFVDRMRFGSVTDFLQVHFYFVPFEFPWKEWPAFNIADSSILIGVGLLVLGWNLGVRKDVSSTA